MFYRRSPAGNCGVSFWWIRRAAIAKLGNPLYLSLMPDEKESTEPQQSLSDSKEQASGEPSADDQMAAYEEDLKNTDWGHQPC